VRGRLRQVGPNTLQTVFHCCWPQGSQQLTYLISQEPSLRVETADSLLSQSEADIVLTAKFAKFGFVLPAITFMLGARAILSLPLPFAPHNFLLFSPEPFSPIACPAATIPLKAELACDLSKVGDCLRGVRLEEEEGKGWQGRVGLGCWQCGVAVRVEGGLLGLEIGEADKN
jgi:hypothetical protein